MLNEDYHALVSALIHRDPDNAERQIAALDSGKFAAWAVRHRLASMLYHLAAPEGGVRGALNEPRMKDIADCLSRREWISELLKAGQDAGIRFGVFKGLGIAHLREIYPEPHMRPLGDLDLWISRGQLPDALRILEGLGFQHLSDDPAVREFYLKDSYHVPLKHPEHGELEIHHAYHRDLPGDGLERIFSRGDTLEVWGHAQPSPTRSDLLLLLCLHLGIQHEVLLWIWLMDIHRLAASLNESEWEALQNSVRVTQTAVFVVSCLELLESIWRDNGGLRGKVCVELDSQLTSRERKAILVWKNDSREGRVSGDALSVARRLSGRPVRGRRRILESLFCHPGVVCRELGVRSDAPGFWYHRCRHIARRAFRALRSV